MNKNRIKKGNFKTIFTLSHIILWVLLLLILLPSAAAVHSICGKVNPAEDGASPAWKTVHIYYSGDPTNYNQCEVAAANNKYCCDSENIPGHTWKVGDIIKVKVIDLGDGYFSDTGSVVTTSEGYDQPADITLLSALIIGSPQETTYTIDSLSLDIESLSPYTHYIKYKLDDEDDVTLCTDCSSATTTLNGLTEGSHTLYAYADDGTNEIVRSTTFTVDTIAELPTIDQYNPQNNEILLNVGEIQQFNITASDPDDDSLLVLWYVDDELVKQENTLSSQYAYTTSADDEGSHIIGVTASDGTSEAFQTWTVEVIVPITCGNERCDGDENCTICPTDCGECPVVCGDGSCNGNESCLDCAVDCGECTAADVCGDDSCSGNETCITCTQDCGACTEEQQEEPGSTTEEEQIQIPITDEEYTNTAYLKYNKTGHKIKFGNIPKGKKVFFRIDDPGISIYEVAIVLKNDINNLALQIKREEPPAELDYPDNMIIYQYINTQHNLKKDDIQEITIKYRVNSQWLKENNISKEQIFVERHNSEWARYNAELKQETQSYIEYHILTDSFEPFFITAERTNQY